MSWKTILEKQRASASASKGFSLIEVMIALVISGLVLVGVFAFSGIARTTTQDFRRDVRIQQSLEGAMHAVGQDVRIAGLGFASICNEIRVFDSISNRFINPSAGLGIGGPGEPWYVAGKDIARNILYVVQGQDHPALYQTQLTASDLSWVRGLPPGDLTRCSAKIRYRQDDTPCHLDIRGARVSVTFDQPQRAVTPGQSVVFYDDEVCLGGCIIQSPTSDPLPMAVAR